MHSITVSFKQGAILPVIALESFKCLLRTVPAARQYCLRSMRLEILLQSNNINNSNPRLIEPLVYQLRVLCINGNITVLGTIHNDNDKLTEVQFSRLILHDITPNITPPDLPASSLNQWWLTLGDAGVTSWWSWLLSKEEWETGFQLWHVLSRILYKIRKRSTVSY